MSGWKSKTMEEEINGKAKKGKSEEMKEQSNEEEGGGGGV